MAIGFIGDILPVTTWYCEPAVLRVCCYDLVLRYGWGIVLRLGIVMWSWGSLMEFFPVESGHRGVWQKMRHYDVGEQKKTLMYFQIASAVIDCAQMWNHLEARPLNMCWLSYASPKRILQRQFHVCDLHSILQFQSHS